MQLTHGATAPGFSHFLSVHQVLERCRLQKRLSSCPTDQGSDVELSADSDTMPPPEEEEGGEACQNPGEEEAVEEHDLQAQVCVQHNLTAFLPETLLGMK